jgi:hypothetical protein
MLDFDGHAAWETNCGKSVADETSGDRPEANFSVDKYFVRSNMCAHLKLCDREYDLGRIMCDMPRCCGKRK